MQSSKRRSANSIDMNINRHFHRLFPVHQLILDILKDLIPAKLTRVSRSLYDELVPKIYRHVILTEHNYKLFIQRALVQAKWPDTIPRDGGTIKREIIGRIIPQDIRAYQDVRIITIQTAACAVLFTKDVLGETIDNPGFTPWIDEQIDLFPQLERLHLGPSVARGLVDTSRMRTSIEEKRNALLRPQYLRLVASTVRPQTICLDWPTNKAETMQGSDSDRVLISRWIMQALTEQVARFGNLNSIHVHILPYQISSAYLIGDEHDLPQLIFYLHLKSTPNGPAQSTAPNTQAGIATLRILKLLWKHYIDVHTRKGQRIETNGVEYSLPKRYDLAEATEQLKRQISEGDEGLWKKFEKSLIVRQEECPCHEDP
ncbi:hypothetical protein IAU59_001186 [Kwoniella sp. CBS 9459]